MACFVFGRHDDAPSEDHLNIPRSAFIVADEPLCEMCDGDGHVPTMNPTTGKVDEAPCALCFGSGRR